MNKPFLVLDCSALPNAIVVECVADGQTLGRMEVYFSSEQSQQLLGGMNDVLTSAGVTLPQLSGITLIHGSERFTVARLGAVTANTLAWTLQIPVCDFGARPTLIEMEEKISATPPATPITPHYSKEPQVTL